MMRKVKLMWKLRDVHVFSSEDKDTERSYWLKSITNLV